LTIVGTVFMGSYSGLN